MIRALAMKEWRETWAFGALALGVYLIYLGNLTGLGEPVLRSVSWLIRGADGKPTELPFIQDNFASTVGFVGCLLAIALGFRQSAWEPHQGTSLYLLHLPLPRRTILATKVLTGIALLLACSLAPILLYGTWAAWPRTHPGPFEWSMTDAAFRAWAMTPLVYLGAFASGIRPARLPPRRPDARPPLLVADGPADRRPHRGPAVGDDRPGGRGAGLLSV